ncbi:diguanylate cyclase [Microbaculum sp. FT89]|uniref:GGDEF domain-containing protein n=1 Tax=Microbaculum sp. FT89 TaxID=3447298 RepID=UPI003F530F59
MGLWDLGLLGCQLVLYFSVLAMLFGLRHRYGIGIFFCALGAMHFLETYLAATFYVAVPFGIIVSPGSTILFPGKIILLLLVYIREDAIAVRQPIYGLFAGNILTIGLVAILGANTVLPSAGQSPDFPFMDQMGLLMIWGTVLLLIDGILIILIYEQVGRWLGPHMTLRIAISGVAVLAFDQVAFWPVLHAVAGIPVEILYGGLIAKSIAAVAYAVLAGIYLRHFERRMFDGLAHPRLADVFDALTYRERYENLLERSGRDGLTGIADRSRMEAEAEQCTARIIASGDIASVLIIDIDNFKQLNDDSGHLVGDAALRGLAELLTRDLRDVDRIYRFGGDEFVVITAGRAREDASNLARRLHRIAGKLDIPDLREPLTVSIGAAHSPEDGMDFLSLLSRADKRLYAAKGSGRDRVVAGDDRTGEPSPELVRPT